MNENMIQKEQIIKKFAKIEDKLLISKLIDKANKAEKSKCNTFSAFLDPYQKTLVEKAFGHEKDIGFSLYGGYIGAERVIAVFCPNFIYSEEDFFDYPLRLIEISHKSTDTLNHRDYLGSLMGLGIKREKIGDILVKENGCSIIVFSDIAEYIVYNLIKVSNVKISLELKDVQEVETVNPETKTIRTTVASMRLDSISASGFVISRSKIMDYIAAEKVSINWEITSNASKLVQQGDTISVRGKGRIFVDEVGKITKKGRIAVVLKKLI